MSNECFDSYLRERYENQVQWYDSRSRLYKRYYHVFQWLAIIISASLPAIIMMSSENDGLLSVALAVILAIVTSSLKTFKFQENWLNYRTIAETLKKERHYYNVGANGYDAVDDKEQYFVERVETLISRENTLWLEIHRKKGKKPDTSP